MSKCDQLCHRPACMPRRCALEAPHAMHVCADCLGGNPEKSIADHAAAVEAAERELLEPVQLNLPDDLRVVHELTEWLFNSLLPKMIGVAKGELDAQAVGTEIAAQLMRSLGFARWSGVELVCGALDMPLSIRAKLREQFVAALEAGRKAAEQRNKPRIQIVKG